MADFRTRLLGLAGAAMVFSGMAFAQNTISCTTLAPSQVSFIRAEGQTELIPQLTIGCANTAATAGLASVTVFFSPTVTVTSALIPGSTTNTEATATVNAISYPGTLNAGAVVFSGLVIPAAVNANITIVLNNIRVNATGIPSTAGAAPSALSVLAFLSGTNVVPGPAPSSGNATTVAYVTNGLSPSKFGSTSAVSDGKVVNASGGNNAVGGTTSSFGVCNSENNSGSATANPDFYVSLSANFQTAFKTQVDESSGVGAELNAAATNYPASGTRVKFVFSNVPAGLNIYMPLTLTATNSPVPNPLPTLSAVTNEVGGKVLQVALTSPNQFSLANNFVPVANSGGGLFQVSVSNGTGEAVYEVTIDNLSVTPTFAAPVYLGAGSNAVTVQAADLTVQTSFAPITAATTVPSFAILASSSPTLSILNFTTCTTSLLFPFVTNGAGGLFDTGIVIDNTTKDPFGTHAQSGTCTLNFYAGSQPNATAGTFLAAVTPVLNGGDSFVSDINGILALTSGNPTTFSGYIIAQCQFQEAHGFAYITYGFPSTSSDTMGYIASVLSRGSTSPESLGE